MWKVFGITEKGERVTFEGSVFSGEAPTAKRTYEAARRFEDELFKPALRHLSEEARQSADGPLPWRDSLSTWGSYIEKEMYDLGFKSPWFAEEDDVALRFRMEGSDLKLIARFDDREEQVGAARHADIFFVIPARLDFVGYEIEWDGEDRQALGRAYPGCDEGSLVIEWRGYFGEQSGIIDGLSTLLRNTASGAQRVARIAMRGAGLIVGTVLAGWCWALQPKGDPTRQVRRLWFERKLGKQLTACQDLRDLSGGVSKNCSIVLVHGTISCAGAIIAQLPPSAADSWYRFEHDTFKPVAQNAGRLAELLQQKLPNTRVLLVAHSRGGLVSALAAGLLVSQGRANVEVLAIGTPFSGTPVATLGGAAIGLFARLGSMSLNGVAQGSLVTAAFARFLTLQSAVPPGITDMYPWSSFLTTLKLVAPAVKGSTSGSDFDINGPYTAMGVFAGSVVGTIFNEANDLVVALSSTRMNKWPAVRQLKCGHTEYFREQAVFLDIMDWLRGCR